MPSRWPIAGIADDCQTPDGTLDSYKGIPGAYLSKRLTLRGTSPACTIGSDHLQLASIRVERVGQEQPQG